jgi:chain length determinant protein EpsF
MNFTQFLLVLKARKWVILLTLFVTVATTIVVSLLLPKTYTATTSLVVDFKGADPVTGVMLPPQLMPGYLGTQVSVIGSHNVALKVVDGLQLARSPTVQEQFQEATEGQGSIRDWLADTLIENLVVEPSRDSNVITVSYKGTEPQFSAALANGFAQAYIQTNLELKVQPARQVTAWYDEQIKQLRDNLEQAQTRLSDVQREKGLVASDERIDVETARLSELSGQLVAAQSQAFDASSREKNVTNLPEVVNSPVVQNIKAETARAEAKLAEMGKKYGRNHPLYQQALAEMESIKQKVQIELDIAKAGVSATARSARNREAELRGAVATQKTRVLAIKEGRDEVSVLLRDVENAQRAYDTAQQRLSQSRLEAQTTQTNIAVLNPAVPPLQPSSPKLLLNTVLSVVLGSMLAIGIGFMMEMVDRRVRSPHDLMESLGIPVLGAMTRQSKKALGGPRALLPFKGQATA